MGYDYFEAGKLAFEAGLPITECRVSLTYHEHEMWVDGWMTAEENVKWEEEE